MNAVTIEVIGRPLRPPGSRPWRDFRSSRINAVALLATMPGAFDGFDHFDNFVDLGKLHVGSDLDEDRFGIYFRARRMLAISLLHGRQQVTQKRFLLQLAQIGACSASSRSR